MEDLHQCLELIPLNYRKEFSDLAELLPNSSAKELVQKLHAYQQRILEVAQTNIDIDTNLIKKMVNCLDDLLENYVDLKSFEKQLVIGAARYFVKSDDAHDDLTDTFGFDDDLAVLNAVLITLGRSALTR